MGNHLGLDLNLIEGFAVVNSDDASSHFRHNDQRALTSHQLGPSFSAPSHHKTFKDEDQFGVFFSRRKRVIMFKERKLLRDLRRLCNIIYTRVDSFFFVFLNIIPYIKLIIIDTV